MPNCVYIHIPFCEKKCNYCAFCSFKGLKNKNKYIKALKNEVKFLYKREKLKTIYFGGGTPSLLDISDIADILSLFNYDNNTQITLEANPYNLTEEKIKSLNKTGINRLSLGIQSFNDEILADIGRLHTKKDAFYTIECAKKYFKNISIDLMYGLPKQDIQEWINTLDIALSLDIQHISLYGLKIEKGTYFYKYLPKKLPDDDMQAVMYEIAIKKLKNKYMHYEFSNFAKNKNFFSTHNITYWQRKNYYGFGLNASGFIKNKRYTNTFNFNEYLNNPTKKEYIKLTKKEAFEEELFLGLRMYNGINFNKLNKKYNIDVYKKYENIFDKYISYNLMKKTAGGIKLTQKGILVSNEILCNFV